MTAPAHRDPTAVRRRGGPLVMLVLLVGGWCSARAMWWENPFATAASAQPQAALASVRSPLPLLLPSAEALPPGAHATRARVMWTGARAPALAHVARLERLLRRADPPQRRAPDASASGAALKVAARTPDPPLPSSPPFLPAPLAPPRGAPAGRWSLDAWAFWREGSGAAPISQGRVPVYGASQAGAVLQYRLAPSRRSDPRLYARAYRALVSEGESELALGASLRPLPRLPLRVAGEVRYTDAALRNTFRPAAYAVTELPPLRLPLGAQFEAYGQAGWVGGPDATAFADAQASLTRALPMVARLTDERLRLSLGAGAWGGAQEGAQRVDIGPTLRLDMRIGTVPARLAVDWRQRVAGDAAPGSGVAATISAGF